MCKPEPQFARCAGARPRACGGTCGTGHPALPFAQTFCALLAMRAAFVKARVCTASSRAFTVRAMASNFPAPIVIDAPLGQATSAVIMLHGLGDSGGFARGGCCAAERAGGRWVLRDDGVESPLRQVFH